MRSWLLIGLLSAMSCDSFLRANPDYCIDDGQCTSETVCNLTLHHCDPGPVGPVTITAISPSVTALAGGDTVVVTGTNFRRGATVTFNGVAATSVDVKSSTDLDVVVPKVDGSCGPATVVVTNSGGSMASSSSLLRWKIGMPAFTQLPGGVPSAPTDVSRIQAVDFDNDGKMDLGVLAKTSHTILIYKGDGQLGFSLIGTGFDAGQSVAEILFAKSDGDAFPDLFASNPTALIFYHNVNGTSISQVTSLTVDYQAIAVGPLGSSNLGDLIGAQTSLAAIQIRYAVQAGTGVPFQITQSLGVSEASPSVAIANMDASNTPLDIVAAQETTRSALIFYGKTGNTYEMPQSVPLGMPPIKIATVDLNHDGNQDLVAIGATTSAPGISTVLSTGSRTFADPVVLTTADSPLMLATGDSGYDFNCDDRPDVVIYNTATSSIQIYLNNGSGQLLTSPVSVPSGGTVVHSFTVADLDGDSRPDIALITTDQAGAHIGVILHNTSH